MRHMDKKEYLAKQTENEVLRRRFSEIKEKFRDLSVAARGLSVAVAQYAALEISRSQLLAAKDALDKTINQPAKED